MKPLGLSQTFQLIHPTLVEDKIWEAVQEALASGWTACQFKNEVASAWSQEMKERAKDDDKELRP